LACLSYIDQEDVTKASKIYPVRHNNRCRPGDLLLCCPLFSLPCTCLLTYHSPRYLASPHVRSQRSRT
jgi:hypothetical protein